MRYFRFMSIHGPLKTGSRKGRPYQYQYKPGRVQTILRWLLNARGSYRIGGCLKKGGCNNNPTVTLPIADGLGNMDYGGETKNG